MAKLTPMMEQYLGLKATQKDAILLFRLGDFFEIFFDDAVVASKALGIALTGRDCGSGERAPMCGVPAHAVDGYTAKLIEKGYVVAIADQVEDAKFAKGIVKREIVRVITPGTVMEENLLDTGKNNYIAAIHKNRHIVSIAFCDITTGDFSCTEIENDKILADELSCLNPAEIVVSENYGATGLIEQYTKKITKVPPWTFQTASAFKCLTAHFGTMHLEGFGIYKDTSVVAALGALLEYLKETAKNSLGQITKIRFYSCHDKMQLDSASRRNLELTTSGHERQKKGSLLWVIDRTKTSMGARLLRSFVDMPLVNADEINSRLESVDEWKQMPLERAELREYLTKIHDIERFMARLSANTATARELAALKQCFVFLPKIYRLMRHHTAGINKSVYDTFDDLCDVTELIGKTIVENPPATLHAGGMICPGVDLELDSLRNTRQNAESLLLEMENQEKKETNIQSLKIRYTRVFGYYIEVSKSNMSKVPNHYMRKQTLANAERYTTEKLRQLEETLLGAEEKIIAIEHRLFLLLRGKVLEQMTRIQYMASCIAALDVLSSLAEAAEENSYAKPVVNDSDRLSIIEGRHPVIEVIPGESFIPNDTELNPQDRLLVLTGPNMAGKSTYMRQVALIVLMAQIGSFVPAKSAEIGVVDRIFTRVGASDDLATGQSTFMVEMTEVANIISQATKNSLIILDEIGRGTSTYDGLSIAWAALEYIAKKIKAKTLFATHYHELTALESNTDGVKNYHFGAKEQGAGIAFTRKLVHGAAGQSYGIHVARLAGLPKELLVRARHIQKSLTLPSTIEIPEESPEETESSPSPLEQALNKIEIEKLTPLDALNKLQELKNL